jgi:polyhydroxybutyrate depolymerase
MRLLLAALLIVTLALPATAAGKREIRYDGETRSFTIEYPAGPQPAPAIVVLHGATATPGRLRHMAEITLSERGWVEIYPRAIDKHWNDGRETAGGKPVHDVDDLGFLRAMLDQLASEGLVDPKRVFFAGYSDGGGLALRVLCAAPELAAGAAVVAMTLPEGLDCAGGPPVPLMLFNGTADPRVPFNGGPFSVPGNKDQGRVLSADETAARFALRNHCGAWDEIDITDHFPTDGTRVRLHVYRGCAAPLFQYVIEGGGHTWPGTKEYRRVREELGRASLDVSATFEIEDFFTDLLRR